MSTIKDVARLAGVGVATASRVLSGKGATSAEAVQRVRAAASTLDYRPSSIARALSLKRSDAIGMYVAAFGDTFYANILARTDEELREVERHLVVANGCGGGRNKRQRALDGIDFLLSRDCDGLILASNELPQADMAELLQRFERTVIVNSRVPGHEAQCFAIDHGYAGRLAARVLLSRGHREIAVLAGPPDTPDNAERMVGFHAELAEHGVSVPDAHHVSGDFNYGSAVQAAERLLATAATPIGQLAHGGARPVLPFSAVFCANDVMAMALISTFAQAGVRVPEDVSVMGYDDAIFASHTSPPLTTVRIPMEAMAINGCRHLINLCYGLTLPVQRDFQPSVVWRASVADGPHARQPLDIPSVA